MLKRRSDSDAAFAVKHVSRSLKSITVAFTFNCDNVFTLSHACYKQINSMRRQWIVSAESHASTSHLFLLIKMLIFSFACQQIIREVVFPSVLKNFPPVHEILKRLAYSNHAASFPCFVS